MNRHPRLAVRTRLTLLYTGLFAVCGAIVVTVSYTLPDRLLNGARLFLTATDLALWTNYTGLDPIVNGNTAAVGGSGAAGIDYGNFPMPRGINLGVKVGF